MRKGIALVISAPSGAGKSTLCNRLLAEFPNICYSISCTTRSPRSGEVDGRDYFFISRHEFEKKRDAGQFAEWAEVHGNFYGTPLGVAREKLAVGRDVLFDIDVQGAAQIKLALPEAVFVFILPPGMAELEKRLRLRGQDDPASIQKRLRNAKKEIGEALWYDALVVNDTLETAYDRLRAVYLAATLLPSINSHLVNALLAEDYREGS